MTNVDMSNSPEHVRESLHQLLNLITMCAISKGVIFKPDPSDKHFGLPRNARYILRDIQNGQIGDYAIVDFRRIELLTTYPLWVVVRLMTSTKPFVNLTQEQIDNICTRDDLAHLLFKGQEVCLVQFDD